MKKYLKIILIGILLLNFAGCEKKEPVKKEVVEPDFAETRQQVEEKTKDVIHQTTNNLKHIKDGITQKADETLDDKTKEDLTQAKDDLEIIGKNSGEAVKEIYEDTVSEKTKAKIRNIGKILSNKTNKTIEEIKESREENENNEQNEKYAQPTYVM